jgi:serine protease Do
MLGVNLADLTPEIAEGFGLASTTQGVVIQSVMDNSPAARAGIHRNDVIIEFAGRPVADLQKFRMRVADTPSGTAVPVTVLRDGKRMNFTVTLDDREKILATASNNGDDGSGSPVTPGVSPSLGGLKVRELTADEKTRAKIAQGVIVSDVEDGSAADRAGLQPGDVIEEVNRNAASSAEAFTRLMNAARTAKRPAVLLVHGQQGTQFIALKLDEE